MLSYLSQAGPKELEQILIYKVFKKVSAISFRTALSHFEANLFHHIDRIQQTIRTFRPGTKFFAIAQLLVCEEGFDKFVANALESIQIAYRVG